MLFHFTFSEFEGGGPKQESVPQTQPPVSSAPVQGGGATRPEVQVQQTTATATPSYGVLCGAPNWSQLTRHRYNEVGSTVHGCEWP